MKIAIGTNYFGQYDRQTRAKGCLLKIKKQYSEVSIHDVKFNDEHFAPSTEISTHPILTRSSRDMFPASKKRLPYINDIFDVLSTETDADYFIYTNSDILISPKLIDYIKNHEDIKAMPCNRMDIYPIKSLNDNLIPYRWEIGGFDVFVLKTEWYKENRKYFEDFLMGSIWFDHHYAGVMKSLTNDKLGNMFPPFVLHEMHNKNWSYEDPEAIYNKKQWETCKYHNMSKRWDDYFASYLKNKRKNGFVMECDDEEYQSELKFFKDQ